MLRLYPGHPEYVPPPKLPDMRELVGRGQRYEMGDTASRGRQRPMGDRSRSRNPGPQHPVHVPGKGQGLIEAVMGSRVLPPGSIPPPPATGPYQGAAGSEAQNPGRPRVPLPDWADPSSPNYERRNYYQTPDGRVVAREPGYYNPDKPWQTGRPGEFNEEYEGSWDPSWERRMDEPGVTPWGPGGKASKPGAFPAPAGAASAAGVSHPVRNPLLETLLGGPTSPVDTSQIGVQKASDVSAPFRGDDPTQALLLALSQMLAKLPGRRVRNAE
jgi:hypothetical protein